MVTTLLQDVRHAGRTLRKNPGTSAVVIATVAVGICAVATVFSVVDALLLKPLPGVGHQRELVNVHATAADGSTFHSVSLPTWRDLRGESGALEDLAGFSSRIVSVAAGGEVRLAVVQVVTANFFPLLQARPALGRFFLPREDEVPGRDAVAVVSLRLWRNELSSDPAIVGRVVSINGHPFTVVGVTEAGFNGNFLGFPFDIWVPSMMAPAVASEVRLEERPIVWLEMIGRLRPGASIGKARQDFGVLARRLELAYPDIYKGTGYDLRPVTGFEDSLHGAAVSFFALLLGLGGLVLAIAGVNVSGILLARVVARERELSVRIALGAGRGRLLRQLLVENVLLFLIGGVLGSALTLGTASLLERFQLPTPVPISFDLQPGTRVLAFALLLSAAAGAVFGLTGTLSALRPASLGLLRTGAATERRAALRLRSAFVVAQVAMSALLLVAAGLFLRTVSNAAGANPGFAPDGLTMTTIDLKLLGYDATRAGAVFEGLVLRAGRLPGVESATTTGMLPLGPGNRADPVSLPGSPAGEPPISVDFCDVGDAYFQTMRLPLLSGRPFGPADGPGAPGAAIVNEALAKRLWPGRDPIGRTLLRNRDTLTVVGLARDAKYRRLWEAPRPFLYLSERQFGSRRRDLVVRGGGPADTVAAALRREIRAAEPNLPFSAVMPVRRYMSFSTLPQQVGGAVAGSLGLVGLLLAAIGLAAQVAYSVSRRTREIGIRIALGALGSDVVRLEASRGARTAVLGLALGLAAALGLSRLLTSFLFCVSAVDPLTFGAVAAMLGAMSFAATLLPARRAARVDPMKALRSE